MKATAAVEVSSIVTAMFVPTTEISPFATAAFVPTTEVSSFAMAAFVAAAEVITIASASEVAMSSIVEVSATVKLRAAIEARAAIKSPKQWAGADKNTAREVTRPVVTVRRARVRSISVVAVFAHWGWTNVGWPDAEADHNSLGMCVRRCDQANSK
jgi:hypothetical protein